MATGPYGRTALAYIRRGWTDPIPMGRDNSKIPAVKGFTGHHGAPVGYEQANRWVAESLGERNIGLRMPQNIIGIDIDAHDGKDGARALTAATDKLGDLPPTWSSTSRGPGQASRIYLYQLPVGRTVASGAEKKINNEFGENIDLIHRGWRHVMVFPSIHPEGRRYEWLTPDGDVHEIQEVDGKKVMPGPKKVDLPMLPDQWVEYLCGGEKGAGGDDFYDPAGSSERWTPIRAQAELDRMLERIRTVGSNINDQAGGAMRRIGRFVPGLLTEDEAVAKCRDALLANEHHSDEWNLSNGKDWTAATLASLAVTRGMEDPLVIADDADDEMQLYTHAWMAPRFVREVLAGRYLYTTALGWLKHDGQRWAEVEMNVLRVDAAEWTRSGYRRACEQFAGRVGVEGGSIADDPAVKGWYRMQSLTNLNALITLAGDELLTDASEFDVVDHELNTPAGVIDMRNGQIIPHSPEQRHTKITQVSYVPGAESAVLKQALEALPDDVPDWLQLRLGEAITGHSSDQMVLLTGGGSNGKTALMGAVWKALGNYAASVPNTLLLKGKQHGAATPEKMTLRGVRLAYMEETPEESYLDANMVKELIDVEVIQGRHLYKSVTSWRPTHTLFLNTNYPPRVVDTGDGAWRRLARVDFPYRYRKVGEPLERPNDRVGDPSLKRKLIHSHEGQEAVLAWMVEGALRFYAAGSLEEAGQEPASVGESKQRWRAESDVVYQFLVECMEFDRNSWVANSDLYEELGAWLDASGHRMLSAREVYKRIECNSALPNYVHAFQARLESPGLSRPAGKQAWLGSSLPARPKSHRGLKFKIT